MTWVATDATTMQHAVENLLARGASEVAAVLHYLADVFRPHHPRSPGAGGGTAGGGGAGSMSHPYDVGEVEAALRLLVGGDDVFEIRMPRPEGRVPCPGTSATRQGCPSRRSL